MDHQVELVPNDKSPILTSRPKTSPKLEESRKQMDKSKRECLIKWKGLLETEVSRGQLKIFDSLTNRLNRFTSKK